MSRCVDEKGSSVPTHTHTHLIGLDTSDPSANKAIMAMRYMWSVVHSAHVFCHACHVTPGTCTGRYTNLTQSLALECGDSPILCDLTALVDQCAAKRRLPLLQSPQSSALPPLLVLQHGLLWLLKTMTGSVPGSASSLFTLPHHYHCNYKQLTFF